MTDRLAFFKHVAGTKDIKCQFMYLLEHVYFMTTKCAIFMLIPDFQPSDYMQKLG